MLRNSQKVRQAHAGLLRAEVKACIAAAGAGLAAASLQRGAPECHRRLEEVLYHRVSLRATAAAQLPTTADDLAAGAGGATNGGTAHSWQGQPVQTVMPLWDGS